MFGRALNEPQDYTGVPDGSAPTPISVADWMTHQEKIVSVIWPSVAARTIVSKDKMAATLNKHRRQLMQGGYPTGAVVMLVDPLRANKFEPKYIGPYYVIRRARNGAYVLRDDTGDMLDRHVPPDQLKLVSRKPRAADIADTTYEVQSILGHRGEPGKYEYHVKWKDHNDRTWEPAISFLDDTVIRNYWRSLAADAALVPVAVAPVPVPSGAAPSPVLPSVIIAPAVSAAASAATASVDAATAAVAAAVAAARRTVSAHQQ
jgi:hypothetical protein